MNICATDVSTVFLCDKIVETVFKIGATVSIKLGAEFGDHAGKCATVDKGLCGVRIASRKSNKTLTMMECKPGKINNGMPEVSTEEMGLEAELMDTKLVEDVFEWNEQFNVSFVKDSGGRFHHNRTGIG